MRNKEQTEPIKVRPKSEDQRYTFAHSIWKAGDLQEFRSIFRIIPKTIISTDLGWNNAQTNKKILYPEFYCFRDVREISDLTGIPNRALVDLVVDNIIAERPKDKYPPGSSHYKYKYIGSVWKAGDIECFPDIFNIVSRSVVALDLRMNYDVFTKKFRSPELFRFREIRQLAKLTGIPFKDLARLVADAPKIGTAKPQVAAAAAST
jgi:hypothetical protein